MKLRKSSNGRRPSNHVTYSHIYRLHTWINGDILMWSHIWVTRGSYLCITWNFTVRNRMWNLHSLALTVMKLLVSIRFKLWRTTSTEAQIRWKKGFIASIYYLAHAMICHMQQSFWQEAAVAGHEKAIKSKVRALNRRQKSKCNGILPARHCGPCWPTVSNVLGMCASVPFSVSRCNRANLPYVFDNFSKGKLGISLCLWCLSIYR